MTSCIQIGNSLFDQPGSEKVAEIVEMAKKKDIKLVFPVDHVIADKFAADARVRENLGPLARRW